MTHPPTTFSSAIHAATTWTRRVSDFVVLLRDGYRTLTNGDQLRVFFDSNDIKGMDDWRHRILDGIRSTRLLLVCLSPNYLESEYCAWEFNEYLKRQAAQALLGEGIAPIYFVEIPSWSDRGFDQRAAEWVAEIRRRQHFDFRSWFNEGTAALKDAALKARLDDLNGQIRERLSRVSRVIDAKGNVDRHNEHCTAELRRLREIATFSSGVTHTLIGVDSLRVFPFLASISGGSRSSVCLKGQGLLSAARCE